MEVYPLLSGLVLLPALSALACFVRIPRSIRNGVILITSLVMIIASGLLTAAVVQSGGHLAFTPTHNDLSFIGQIVAAIDLVVLFYVIFRGLSARRYFAPILAVIQLIALGVFDLGIRPNELATPVVIDYLSLILVLIASIIGPLILIFGIGYMQVHEEHLHLSKSRQPQFFAILFVFLSAMNALVVTDNLLWMWTFWEVTTLCSFLLIGHDGTEESIRNAFLTLNLNMIGGVAFILGVMAIYRVQNSLSLIQLCATPIARDAPGLVGLGVACLCFAGMTKAAQFPFQSWLLGAMVAPTPVSALLHSSTMVKAGVYMVVRLAPTMVGSTLGQAVSFAGGFTFLAAAAIAISQRNGKRVLAYSTISNLGLIVCCAGIGTQAALGAAILLIIFHAISKAMLFLCIGTIEQEIGSRDIEDMQGLFKQMPFTTVVTAIAMISMLLPPFGVLLTKWIAIESAVHLPIVLLMIVLGSAFTVVFWSKWIGIILTMSYKQSYPCEKLPTSMAGAMSILLIGILTASAGVTFLFNRMVAPYLHLTSLGKSLTLSGSDGGLWLYSTNHSVSGGMSALPLFAILLFLIIIAPFFFRRTRPEMVKPPYFGGDLANNDVRGIEFMGPGDRVENIIVHNYYMVNIFGEDRLTIWANGIAIALILIMFGMVLL